MTPLSRGLRMAMSISVLYHSLLPINWMLFRLKKIAWSVLWRSIIRLQNLMPSHGLILKNSHLYVQKRVVTMIYDGF